MVPRPRLLDELRSGRGHALTLVCAPAGYGKTTLVSQWMAADANSSDFAWVALENGDADPVRFWTYVVAALSEIAPLAGRRSLAALSRRPEQLRTDALPLLIGELEQGDRNLVLVLEDYHLAEGTAVAESVAYFIDRRPSRLQVVLATRSDPQLPLGRWRANGQLAEIRAGQLCFADQEVADFFGHSGIETAMAALDRLPDPGILPALAASLQGKFLVPTRRSAAFGQELSEREVVVLRLLATGLSQREIAAQLYVSHNTVKTQVRMAYRKLGAGTRAQAVRHARDLGVLGTTAP